MVNKNFIKTPNTWDKTLFNKTVMWGILKHKILRGANLITSKYRFDIVRKLWVNSPILLIIVPFR